MKTLSLGFNAFLKPLKSLYRFLQDLGPYDFIMWKFPQKSSSFLLENLENFKLFIKICSSRMLTNRVSTPSLCKNSAGSVFILSRDPGFTGLALIKYDLSINTAGAAGLFHRNTATKTALI